ncbi:MAG: efflux RND transporter periplasmic adaptor subunit [Fusobacteriaceae bacterium]
MNKLLSILFLILTLIGCGKEKNNNITKSEILKDVKLYELKVTTIKNTQMYNGELKPATEITIITPTGGYVTQINFKNGDTVTENKPILVLSDATTEGNFYETNGTLIKAKSNYSTTKTSFNKYEILFKKNLISEELYLESKNKMQQSLGDLKISEANHIKANDNFKRLTVTSKIKGVITDLTFKENEKVNADTKLLTIIDNSKMEIKIAVSPEDIKNIEIGKEANIIISSVNKTLTGYISDINYSSNSDTKKYEVKILLDNEDKALLKGMYAKVKMEQGEIKGLFVPKEAVMIKDLYSYIAVIRDSKAIVYKVQRGISEGNLQEILFDEFKENDKVVVQGQYLLNNNDKVREI